MIHSYASFRNFQKNSPTFAAAPARVANFHNLPKGEISSKRPLPLSCSLWSTTNGPNFLLCQEWQISLVCSSEHHIGHLLSVCMSLRSLLGIRSQRMCSSFRPWSAVRFAGELSGGTCHASVVLPLSRVVRFSSGWIFLEFR